MLRLPAGFCRVGLLGPGRCRHPQIVEAWLLSPFSQLSAPDVISGLRCSGDPPLSQPQRALLSRWRLVKQGPPVRWNEMPRSSLFGAGKLRQRCDVTFPYDPDRSLSAF